MHLLLKLASIVSTMPIIRSNVKTASTTMRMPLVLQEEKRMIDLYASKFCLTLNIVDTQLMTELKCWMSGPMMMTKKVRFETDFFLLLHSFHLCREF